MLDLPLLILALTLTWYWGRVGNMVRRARRHAHDLAGLVPEQTQERLTWLVIVPLVAAWIAMPWIALAGRSSVLALPAFASLAPYAALRALAAGAGVGALWLTIKCWKRMGKDWRMDMSEKNRAALITDGLYERVRHPIYALQIGLMAASVIVLPVWPMLAIAIVHAVVMTRKARNEERHLLALHGQRYADYLARTGRFVPRGRPASRAGG
jgi:protein-S-isoprenylcysteine O-methyltransferase Ste14